MAPSVPAAALDDPQLHRARACIDAIRGGQSRERKWGMDELAATLQGR
jgi:hypothetical protein